MAHQMSHKWQVSQVGFESGPSDLQSVLTTVPVTLLHLSDQMTPFPKIRKGLFRVFKISRTISKIGNLRKKGTNSPGFQKKKKKGAKILYISQKTSF